MADLADEETDNSSYADERPFYKLEKWTKDGTKVDRLLYAGNDLDRGAHFALLDGQTCSK
jgi:hypothetical protein